MYFAILYSYEIYATIMRLSLQLNNTTSSHTKAMLRFPVLLGALITVFMHSTLFADHYKEGFPFIPNLGQWSGDFQYKAQIGNLDVYAEASGFTYVYSEKFAHPDKAEYHDYPDSIRKHAFRLKFKDAQSIYFEGEKRSKAYHNYFIGSDRSKWKGHVPLFEKLRSTELYPGIRVLAYHSDNLFKYDYMIDPGSDPDQIVFQYSGADHVSITDQGILIKTSVGDILESIPLSYQVIDGKIVEVRCVYKISRDGFGFNFPEGYNTELPLIIDPVLVAATLSGTGSGGSNYGHGAAFDLAGNIYTHGISFQSNYPVTEGAFQEVFGGGSTDVAISKFNPTGSELIYATFIGGNHSDYPHSIITNNNQELYIFGSTQSPDFPTSVAAVQPQHGGGFDIFITVLSTDGSEIVGSTYLGGSEEDGVNETGFASHGWRKGEIYVDKHSNVYIAGCSSSDDFPTTEGSVQPIKKGNQDGVVAKLNPDLSQLIWSTFIGSEEDDMVYGIRTSRNDNVFITGGIGGIINGGSSNGFITTPGAFQETFAGGTSDGFVAEISADGSSLINSTLLGGELEDVGLFLDIDNQDNIWIYMKSQSDWATTDGVWGTGMYGKMVVHKLKPDLSELLVTSYLSNEVGSNGNPIAFMVDLCNNIYVSCYGASHNLVTTQDALFELGGFYVGVFSPDMEELTYGTFYTGSHVDGGTSRFDKRGIVYQGVCSGGGFNTTDDAYATGQATGWDIGVFKIDFEVESVNAVADAIGMYSGCAPHNVEFTNYSEGDEFFWDFGDGTTSSEYSPAHNFSLPGDYMVELIVTKEGSCNISDTTHVLISVYADAEISIDFDYSYDCLTGEILITDNSSGPGDLKYFWNMGDGTVLTEKNPTHIYDTPGEYTITLTLSSAACNKAMSATETFFYQPFLDADFDVEVGDICDGFVLTIQNLTAYSESYSWDMGDGTILEHTGDFQHTYTESGSYTVQLIVTNSLSCNISDTTAYLVEFDVPPVLDPSISAGQIGLCNELVFQASATVEGEVSSYNWFINDQLISNQKDFEYHLQQEGEHILKLLVTDPLCENTFSTFVPIILFENFDIDLPSSATLCYGSDNLTLDATIPYPDAVYNWNNGVSAEPIFTVEHPGDYEVTISYSGCQDTQIISVKNGQKYNLYEERLICAHQSNSLRLFDDFPFIEAVYWANGHTGSDISISEPGFYAFTALDVFGCYHSDSLLTIARDVNVNLEIPNVFTPNNDGMNDVFQIQADSLVHYNLDILNRWGKKVFSTFDIGEHWDGAIEESGNNGHDSNFFYILKYRGQCDINTQVVTGNISILR